MTIKDRPIELQQVPLCNILGVNIAAVNMQWLLEFIDKNFKSLSGKYICVSNVHTTVMAYENKDYLNVQNSAALAIPDGGPLSSVGQKRGFTDMQRTTGPDFMTEIFKVSVEKGYKHYFYGATTEIVEKMIANLKKKYEGINICGYYCPPFTELTPDENSKIAQTINNSEPDFIWVGLGAPKQEFWMYEHKDKFNALMVGVGAGFAYFAGNIKRAPKWMQKSNLEWLYRLIQEPKRLLKRYLITNTKFIWNVVVKGK